jgi:hypothetical protein
MTRKSVSAAFALAVLFVLTMSARPPAAVAARFAVMVGNNEGHATDDRLQFAEKDATRLGLLLQRLGQFSPDATVMVLGRSADELRESFSRLADRLRSTPGEHLLLVYYSGHADAQGLHMGPSTFPLGELKAMMAGFVAGTRVLIVDACQAGLLTSAKGGRAGAGFDLRVTEAEAVKGLAILASSTDTELAQESSELQGSVFTHHLQEGLAGLADHDHDGNVTLSEAFDFASARTVASTAATTTGPQHPTYRLDLAGRDELVLTRPGATGLGYGQLKLDVPGWYFVRRADGSVATEVRAEGHELVALDAGRYEVTRRESRHLEIASVLIQEGRMVTISETPQTAVRFGRMVRKGGGPSSSYGIATTVLARSSFEGLGASLGAGLTGRADYKPVSWELHVDLGRAEAREAHVAANTWEGALRVAALKVKDFGAHGGTRLPTGALGVEAGMALFSQSLDTGERKRSVSPFAGPVAVLEWPLTTRLFLRADVDLRFYWMRTSSFDGRDESRMHPAVAAGLGAGAWF